MVIADDITSKRPSPHVIYELEKKLEQETLRIELPKEVAIKLYAPLADELKKAGYIFLREELITREVKKGESLEFLKYTFCFSNLY